MTQSITTSLRHRFIMHIVNQSTPMGHKHTHNNIDDNDNFQSSHCSLIFYMLCVSHSTWSPSQSPHHRPPTYPVSIVGRNSCRQYRSLTLDPGRWAEENDVGGKNIALSIPRIWIVMCNELLLHTAVMCSEWTSCVVDLYIFLWRENQDSMCSDGVLYIRYHM